MLVTVTVSCLHDGHDVDEEEAVVARGGSVPCVRKVAGSNPAVVATYGP